MQTLVAGFGPDIQRKITLNCQVLTSLIVLTGWKNQEFGIIAFNTYKIAKIYGLLTN